MFPTITPRSPQFAGITFTVKNASSSLARAEEARNCVETQLQDELQKLAAATPQELELQYDAYKNDLAVKVQKAPGGSWSELVRFYPLAGAPIYKEAGLFKKKKRVGQKPPESMQALFQRTIQEFARRLAVNKPVRIESPAAQHISLPSPDELLDELP